MPVSPLVIYIAALGEPERGLWCSRCLLPSAVRVHYGLSSATSPIEMGTIERCLECGDKP